MRPRSRVFAPALAALFVLVAGSGRAERAGDPRPAAAIAGRRSRLARKARTGCGPRRPCADAPPTVAEPARASRRNRPPQDAPPAFAAEAPAGSHARGWTEERLVVAGFVLLAFLAGLIIFIASFFDSLT